MKLLERMYNFTIHDNMGFQIAFGDIVVSVCAHNYFDSFSAMKGNGISGSRAKNFSLMPKDIPFFTFNNAEICIFNQVTEENLNKVFLYPEADDYEEYVDPNMLVDILIKVREYTNKKLRQ